MVPKATIELFDRLIRWSFYALILTLPVGIGFVSSFAAFAITFFWLKRICLIINNRIRGFGIIKALFFPVASPLNVYILAFVLAAFVSVIFSQNHMLSFMGFFGKLMRGVFLYISFIEVFTTVRSLNAFLFTWIFSALMVGLSGLSQYFFGADFIRQLPLVEGRVSSTMRQANDFGAYLVAICPLILGVLMHWDMVSVQLEKYVKIFKMKSWILVSFLFLAYVVLVICLGLTFSRSAWVGFFMSIIFLGIFKKESLPFIFLIIVGFIWIFTPFMVATRDVSLITDNVKNVNKTGTTDKSSKLKALGQYIYRHLGSGRWGFWEEATHIIHDYPWWGSGINTYSQMGSRYKINWGGYPHNSYLQLTAELGILGLGTFFCMIGALFYHVLRKIKLMQKGYFQVTAIGVLASMTAYLIESFFDTTFYSVQLSVLMWIMMAVMIATVRMNQLTKPTR